MQSNQLKLNQQYYIVCVEDYERYIFVFCIVLSRLKDYMVII